MIDRLMSADSCAPFQRPGIHLIEARMTLCANYISGWRSKVSSSRVIARDRR